MNAFSSAERGYLQNITSTRSHRRTEYEVVARVTQKLRDASQNAKKNFSNFAVALDDNRKLWRAFALDVSNPDNALPDSLKSSIFYLSEFTDQYTQKVLNEGLSVMPLLEVNVAILRGLKPEGKRE